MKHSNIIINKNNKTVTHPSSSSSSLKVSFAPIMSKISLFLLVRNHKVLLTSLGLVLLLSLSISFQTIRIQIENDNYEQHDLTGDDYDYGLSNSKINIQNMVHADFFSSNNNDNEQHMKSRFQKNNVLQIQKELEQMDTIPFYMYSESNLTLDAYNFVHLLPKRLHMMAAEMLYDLATIQTLYLSPWRTNNPNDAKLFVIPIPFGKIATSVKHEFYDSTMDYLVNHTLFQRTKGHNHVLIATPFILFRGDRKLNQHGMLSKWLPYLWNVTVVSSWDQNAVVNLSQQNYDFYEYTTPFKSMKPLTKKTFSVGLTGGTNFPLKGMSNKRMLETYQFPLTLASMEKFKKSSYLVFYHSPLGHNCYHNSTIHRNAPITNVTLDTFPKSSIGNGFSDRNIWLETYRDSKFCLCIRG